jgi:hypothetical protein
MATITLVQLVAPAELAGTDAAAVYTAPALTSAKIGRAVFTNTTAGPITITAGITTGGALAADTTLISGMTLAAGQAYVSPELAGAVLPAGSAIRAYASAATSITFTASGLIIQ